MGSTRMKGSALSLTFDGIDYWADVTRARLTNVANGEPLRNYDGSVAYAPSKYLLRGTAIQSLQSTSFWRYVWANPGKIIDFRYSPLGNREPLTNSPHFVGKVQVGLRPTLGGDAGEGEFDFEFEWQVIGEPDIDDGSTPES